MNGLISHHPMRVAQKNRGFTLLEMMVAIAVLAILFSVVYSAINSAVNARSANRLASEQLIKLHRGLSLIEQDLEHVIARFSQFPNEDWKPALAHKDVQEGEVLSFSRHGWPITQNQDASSLARVAYELVPEERDENRQGNTVDNSTRYKLYRLYWRDIDSLKTEPLRKRVILRGIKSIKFKFLNEQNNWVDTWPSESGNMGDNEFDDALAGSDMSVFQRLPRAMELILDTYSMGEIHKIFIFPEGHGV